MTPLGMLSATSSSGLAAYQRILGQPAESGAGNPSPGGSGQSFGAVLGKAIESTIQQGSSAETQARQGLAGEGNMTQVVTSVAQAQLALQTAATIRDRLIQAYQSIANMPI